MPKKKRGNCFELAPPITDGAEVSLVTFLRSAIFPLPSVTKQEKKAVDKHTRTEASAFSVQWNPALRPPR